MEEGSLLNTKMSSKYLGEEQTEWQADLEFQQND